MIAEIFGGASEQQSLLTDSANHLFYAAFQKPVTAVTQVIDKAANTHLVESTKFIETPKQAEFGSGRWHAEQIATGVGSFVPFVASMAIARPLLRPLQEPLLKTFSTTGAQTVFSRYALGEAATAGFISGSVFEPSHNDGSLLGSRIKQGVTGATTMSVLHAGSNTLGRFTGASAAEAGIVRKALTTGIAGMGAGGAAYLTDTALNGRSFDAREMAQSAYALGFTGAALGAGADGYMRLNMPKSKLPSVDEYVARNYDGASVTGHYLGWLARQSVEGRAGLVSKWISERFSERAKNGEKQKDAERETGLAWSLNLDDFAPLDRVAMVAKLQKLANTEMVSNKALDSLVAKLTNASEKFEKVDIARLYDNVDKAQAKLVQRWEAQEKINDLASDRRPKPISKMTEKGYETIYPDHPREVKAERRVKAALAERDRAKQELDAVLEPRLAKMNHAVNEWLAEQKLSPVEVTAGRVDGAAGYGLGKLTISTELLNSTHINPEQTGLILHELLHHKQFSMIVRRMADEVGIGKQADSSQWSALTDLFVEAIRRSMKVPGKTVTDSDLGAIKEILEPILKARNGERLTPEEARQAKIFQAAQESYTLPPWKDRHDAFLEQYIATKNLEGSLSAYSAKQFLHEIHENPRESARKYGFKKIPEALKQMADANASRGKESESMNFGTAAEKSMFMAANFPDQGTIVRVKEILNEQLRSTEKTHERFGQMDYNWYMGSALERQAYPAGLTAFLFAQQRFNQSKNSNSADLANP